MASTMKYSSFKVSGVSFATYTSEDIHKLSVKRITNPVAFDSLQHPTNGGLYDPALGPIDNMQRCKTCSLLGSHCPGHIGHVELPLVVYNPLFFSQMFNLLRSACRYCHHLKTTRPLVHKLVGQLHLLDLGLIVAAREMEHIFDEVEPEDSDATLEEAKEKDRDVGEYWQEKIERKMRLLIEEAGLDPDHAKPEHRGSSTNELQYRRGLISEFLKDCTSRRSCPSCGGVSRRLTNESHIKIFANALQKKDAVKMSSKKLAERSMIPKAKSENGAEAMSESEDESAEDEEEEEEEDEESESEESDGDDGKKKKKSKKPVSKSDTKAVSDTDKVGMNKEYMTPAQAQEHLEALWVNEAHLMPYVFGSIINKFSEDGAANHLKRVTSPSLFFLNVVAVPPARFRPPSIMGDKTFENPQTVMLTEILKDCAMLHELSARKMDPSDGNIKQYELKRMEQVNNTWQNLQLHVNIFMDSSLAKNANDATPGIRQALERKEGLFRMHMMGKRVNYAARSVISPDPMIGTNEVGVPMVFATKLTYPEPVTAHNVHQLREMVINGPDVHPGATHVEDEQGFLRVLSGSKRDERIAIADQLLTPQSADGVVTKPKKVHRHIRNGDWVLMNRQPTLHKASMMAHQVRVLSTERTMRLHYANCKSYNADFDGDEMNLHFPQNEFGRAEAMNIATTDNQYIGLGGEPLRGLIQDHLIAAVRITARGVFFTRTEYQQLVYNALKDNYDGKKVIFDPPTIFKPQPLWSGKQVFSAILKNLTAGYVGLNLQSSAKINNSWSKGSEGLDGEQFVLFRGGDMLIGVLDKNQCGASSGGLVHAVQEIYGGAMAGELLTAIGKVATWWLKSNAASLSIDDLLLTKEANQARRKIIDAAVDVGRTQAAQFVMQEDVNDLDLLQINLETILRDEGEAKNFDNAMMAAAGEITSKVINSTMPSGLVKAFPDNFFQLMVQSGAKGGNVNATQISCLLGQQALEGRRVPVMASGKTLPSFPAFDTSLRSGGMITDRFLTGLRPQEFFFHCMAGREGLVDTAVKTSRSGYLQRCMVKHLEDMKVHYDLTVRDADGSVIQFRYGEDALDTTKTTQMENFKLMGDNYVALLDKFGAKNLPHLFPGKYATKAVKYHQKALTAPLDNDPVLALLRPDRYFGCVSEEFTKKMEAFLASKDGQKLLKAPNMTADKFRQLMALKNLHALAEPGESIGVQAAQAIGEPSTQMTLNTFHFAGRSDMNVTLGIPRLREVVMTASKLSKTPYMTAPLVDESDATFDLAKRICAKLQPVTLKDVLQKVEVVQSLGKHGRTRCRIYKIKFVFVEPSEYQERCGMKPKTLLQILETKFLPTLPKIAEKTMETGFDKSPVEANDEEEEEDGEAPAKESSSKKKKDSAPDALDEPEGSEEEDEEDLGEDAGTLASSAKGKKNQGGLYEDEAEEGEEESEVEEDDGGIEVEAEMAAADDSKPKSSHRAERIANLLKKSGNIADYDYDKEGRWCEITLRFPCNSKRLLFVSILEKLAPKVIIRATKGVKRSALIKTNKKVAREDALTIEGLNIRELWRYTGALNMNKLAVNDVNAMMENYGVEAARMVIIRELNAVFGVYGISVSHRHLSLVADYMTFDGGYRGMNRMTMRANSNPFLKMSFETTTEFMKAAILHGEHDPIQSNSACLVVGRPIVNGTGLFDLVQPLV